MRSLKKILQLRLEAERQAEALPALMMMAEKSANTLLHGEHNKRKTGGGQKFWQFREYMPEDRPQDIDWRQSAKTDHIYIRQREQQTTQKTYLWCASGKGMDFSSSAKVRTKHECALILSLGLGIMLMRGEEQIGAFGDPSTGKTESKLSQIAHALYENAGENILPHATEFIIPKHAALIMAGDFLSPLADIETTFSMLAAHTQKAVIIQTLDPAEIELPYQGRVRFEGTDTSVLETINNVPAIRAQYQERIQSHIKGVADLCKRHHWHHALHRSDDDLTQTLRAIWMHNQTQGQSAW